MLAEGPGNWVMWKASAASFGVADFISRDGTLASASFAKFGMWLETSRVRWFPGQFEDSTDNG